jgi:hypothetical protein
MAPGPRHRWLKSLGVAGVGRRGAGVLALTAVVAGGLAVHGYQSGGFGNLSGSLTGRGSGAATSPQSRPTAPPSASASHSPRPGAAKSSAPGPLLSSSQYAPYSYQIYPGTPSSQTQLAMAGFQISVQPHGGLVDLTVTQPGTGQPPVKQSYAAADHIYFIEASFGDDSGNSEFNLGDDGIIGTDAQGHIIK